MTKIDEQILKAAKEVIVKYIEVGRVSPAAFHENFQKVYKGIYDTVHNIEYTGNSEEKEDEN
ncbi:MAG: hypothetical protein RBR08_09665 [Desulforegulaceae bacterium]|jgi:hypothetical protein|nr:hypothetical protein [Desulforegulaceae bacterium]